MFSFWSKKISDFNAKNLLVAFYQTDTAGPRSFNNVIDRTNPLQMCHPDTQKFLHLIYIHILLLVHTIQLQVRVPASLLKANFYYFSWSCVSTGCNTIFHFCEGATGKTNKRANTGFINYLVLKSTYFRLQLGVWFLQPFLRLFDFAVSSFSVSVDSVSSHIRINSPP